MDRIADVAGRALLAHPPKTLEPFASRDGLPVAVSSVLGQLGDQRAVALLRGALTFERKPTADDESLLATEEDDGKARLAAAKALARLGDQIEVQFARSKAASADPFQKLAGVSILLMSGAADARQGLVPLLSGPTRREALALAYASPGARSGACAVFDRKGARRLEGRYLDTGKHRRDASGRSPERAHERSFPIVGVGVCSGACAG